MNMIEFSAIPFATVATGAKSVGSKPWLIGTLIVGIIVLVYLGKYYYDTDPNEAMK